MTFHYEATIDDPGAYTRPWTIGFDLNWNPNGSWNTSAGEQPLAPAAAEAGPVGEIGTTSGFP